MKKGNYIIYTDTGGTFTDCIILREDGRYFTGKSPTTPEKLDDCFFNAVKAATERSGESSVKEVLNKTVVLGYGTTQGTNVVITGQGAPNLWFLTTAGHEDRTVIMRLRAAGLSRKEGMHIARADKPKPLIPRKRIRGIIERTDCKGNIVIPLDEENVRKTVKELVDKGAEGIAVGLLWSFLEPSRERRIREIIQEMKPGLPVALSSDVSLVIREYPRFMVTIIDLYIGKALRELLETIKGGLENLGYKKPLLIMQAYGGLARSENVKPATTLHSGPVGGLIGVDFFKTIYGFENGIGSDVGGTSFDICFSPKGEIVMLREPIAGRFEISNPMREIITIGAGGGTMAYIDKITNTLRVGPESAAADPGPVCYDKGGIAPTVTDADLLMNRLNPNYFLGGRLKLNKEKAVAAIKEQMTEPLKIDVFQIAEAICKIADGMMQAAISTAIAARGVGPKNNILFCYGGAGPSHCAGYTNGMEFGKIVIPSFAAVFSAFGASTSDVKHRYEASPFVRFINLPYDPISLRFELNKLTSLNELPSEMIGRFNNMFEMLEKKADEDMAAEGFKKEAIRKNYEILARYTGQLWELRCPIPVKKISTIQEFRSIISAFEEKYIQIYTREATAPRGGLEIIGIAVEAIGETIKPKLIAEELKNKDANQAIKEKRDVYFDGKWWNTTIYDIGRLLPGNTIEGPGIVEALDMTVVIPPSRKVWVDQYRNFILEYR